MVSDVLGQGGVTALANVLVKLSRTPWGLPKTGFPPPHVLRLPLVCKKALAS